MTKGRMALSRRSVLAGGMVLGAGAILPGCKPVMSGLLTGADAHPGDYPTVRAVEFMGRYLDEKTGGRLGIRMFAGSASRPIRWRSPVSAGSTSTG
jgi:TRAP-type C4-dicarboxylate transport system substrate-binding protein